MTPRRLDFLVQLSRWSMAVLLALAAGSFAGSCRKELPRPPDGVFPVGGGGTGNGGASGQGGMVQTGGTSGGGGSTPVDTISTDTTHTDGGPCGMPGQPCCPGNECKGMLPNTLGCCERGVCTQHGSTCKTHRDSYTCINGRCGGECGPSDPPAPSDVCCEDRTCTSSFSTCTGDGRGRCVSCGGMGQICCPNGYCRAPLSCLAITGMCVLPAR